MVSEKRKTKNECIATDWLEEDNLMLLECWSRDGYTFQDIANRIGIAASTLRLWRLKYEEIDKALKNGREIIDYKVENALLKSALGYKTKEVKIITNIKNGEIVETTKEVTHKEQTPNVSAIQCWLYNRLPSKWKKNRDNIIDIDEEDSRIQVVVTRASKESIKDKQDNSNKRNHEDSWEETVNQSIEISNKSEQEIAKEKRAKASRTSVKDKKVKTKAKIEYDEDDNDDIDYWPDDWEEE